MAEPTPARKARLRADARDRRRQMAGGRSEGRAERLWANVVAELTERDRLGPGRMVMAFHGFGDEPRTEALFDAVWSVQTDLALPRVDDGVLVPVRYRRGDPLVTSAHGVPEPTGPALDPRSPATVVVPGLTFDRRGHRLGYGAGHYDRFLATVVADCLVMGACLHPLLVDELPADDHDIAVHVVVTDEEVVQPPP